MICILSLAMLKSQSTICYFNYIAVIITTKLCNFDFNNVKIAIYNAVDVETFIVINVT